MISFITKDGFFDNEKVYTTSVLHFMILLFDSSKSDERRKTKTRETCIEVSVLLSDMKGSDTSV